MLLFHVALLEAWEIGWENGGPGQVKHVEEFIFDTLSKY